MKDLKDTLHDLWVCDEVRLALFFTLLVCVVIFIAWLGDTKKVEEEIEPQVIYLIVQNETKQEEQVEEEESPPADLPDEVMPSDIYPNYTDEEVDLIALCTMAEAEGEPELGQRLVIDVILNRCESGAWGSTIHDVVYAPNQFTSMTNGRADKCYVKESIRSLVLQEIVDRTDPSVLYFRTGHYHDFGIQLYKIGNHYFSTK